MPWYDVAGAIAANTLYCDKVLCGKNVGVTLPEVTPETVEVNAGGPIDLPISGQIGSMELAITKTGLDDKLGLLAAPERHDIEIRAVQDVLQNNGKKVVKPIKAFLGVIPKSTPGLAFEMGEASENEFTYECLRYQLYVDNVEQWCIDKANGVFRYHGKDYGRDIESLL